MKPKLIKPARINEILDNCHVSTKADYTCAARSTARLGLAYPIFHNVQDIMCNEIKKCDDCFLQQRNILNIIKYIKKNKLHTELCLKKEKIND